MTDFTFTSTAECGLCGAHLSSSDEDCDHDGTPVDTWTFRRLYEGRDSLVGVECTNSQKWYKLEEKVGDDWIAYQFIGRRNVIESMLSSHWDSVEDLPVRSTAVAAPSDVGETED
jgi:hypothetical protein